MDSDASAAEQPLSNPSSGATVRSRFQRGIAWSAAAGIATSGFNFLLSIAVARLLGRDTFGRFGMVQTTIAAVAGVAQLAMGFMATKYIAEFRFSDRGRAGRVVSLCAAVSMVTATLAAASLWFGASWLAANSLRAPNLTLVLKISVVMVFFTVLTGYQVGVLAGLESYRNLAYLAAATGLVNLSAAAAGAFIGELPGAVAGLGIASFFQWVMFRSVTGAACRRAGITVPRIGFWEERPLFFWFALPAALSGLSSMPAVWISSAFLARQPNGFSELGLYTAALNLRTIVFFLPTLLNRVTMSLLNSQKGSRDWSGYRSLFRTNLMITGSSVIVGAGGIALVGVPVLLLFGRDFRPGYPILLVLLASAIPEAIAMAVVQVVHSQARLWLSFFLIALPKDCTMVLLAYLLTPGFGAVGLAAAYFIAWSITLVTVCLAARSTWPKEAHAENLPA